MESPFYTVENEVIYTADDPIYQTYEDINKNIRPVTSSHPQSSSLGLYKGLSSYGCVIPASLIGPPVPPPNKYSNASTSDTEYYSDYFEKVVEDLEKVS